jgi:hypothetical protein
VRPRGKGLLGSTRRADAKVDTMRDAGILSCLLKVFNHHHNFMHMVLIRIYLTKTVFLSTSHLGIPDCLRLIFPAFEGSNLKVLLK